MNTHRSGKRSKTRKAETLRRRQVRAIKYATTAGVIA